MTQVNLARAFNICGELRKPLKARRRNQDARLPFGELLKQLQPRTAAWLVVIAAEAGQYNSEGICDRSAPRDLEPREGPEGTVVNVYCDDCKQLGWPKSHRRYFPVPCGLFQLSCQDETFWGHVGNMCIVWKRNPQLIYHLGT